LKPYFTNNNWILRDVSFVVNSFLFLTNHPGMTFVLPRMFNAFFLRAQPVGANEERLPEEIDVEETLRERTHLFCTSLRLRPFAFQLATIWGESRNRDFPEMFLAKTRSVQNQLGVSYSLFRLTCCSGTSGNETIQPDHRRD
jgi:hypothetical protein